MAIEVEFTGEVDRTLPHAELDGTDIDVRLNRYREQMVANSMFQKHVLADEGSYFTTNNAQTGLATAAAPTAFSSTNPFILIYNASAPSDDFALRYYIDQLVLCCTAAGTAATSIQLAITLDRGNRYSSGGTDLTSGIRNVTQAVSRASAARIYAGNITASAATANARTVVGNRFLKGAIGVAGDTYTIAPGSGDMGTTISASTSVYSTNNVPPLVLGPDESMLIHLWFPAQSAASSYLPEVTWYER